MWLATRPAALEAEGVFRAVAIAEVAECDLLRPARDPKKTPDDAALDLIEAGFGSPAVETLLAVTYDAAVNGGRLSLPELVRLVSENPARIFGLYPRKVALVPGSDADLVLCDPQRVVRLSADTLHSSARYTLYEGRECLGAPRPVMQRGRLLVREGELVGGMASGEFLPTGPFDVFLDRAA